MENRKKKKTKLLIIVALLGIVVIVFLYTYREYGKQQEKWVPTFVNNETKPFDTYICYHLLQELNGKRNVVSTRQPIYTNLKDSLENYFYYENENNDESQFDSSDRDRVVSEDGDEEQLEDSVSTSIDPLSVYDDIAVNDTVTYLFINTNFRLEAADKEYLFDFVGIGNNLFISAEYIDMQLLDYLNIGMGQGTYANDTIYNMVDNPDRRYNFNPVFTTLTLNIEKSKYPVRVLAKNREGKPIFIQVRYGKGNIFLHTVPNAFTNQNLVKSLKYDFAFRCLSYIPRTNKILWDEYQTQGPIVDFFKEMGKNTPLLLALFIIIIGFLIFVIFRAKRVQRVIPIIKPPVNSSIEFLDTISNLYYKKKDFRIIADKRHAYFLDFIRKNYYLPTEHVDGEFIKNVSIKSGFSEETLKDLFKLYDEIKLYSSISNDTFLKYNHLLEEFYRAAKNK